MISSDQLSAALQRLDPRDWEVLDLSLRRRVPDEALARLFATEPPEVARRRAFAIEHLADELGVQRGEDLGAVLKALLEPATWEVAEFDQGEGWQGFSDPDGPPAPAPPVGEGPPGTGPRTAAGPPAAGDPAEDRPAEPPEREPPPAEPPGAPQRTSDTARHFRITPPPELPPLDLERHPAAAQQGPAAGLGDTEPDSPRPDEAAEPRPADAEEDRPQPEDVAGPRPTDAEQDRPADRDREAGLGDAVPEAALVWPPASRAARAGAAAATQAEAEAPPRAEDSRVAETAESETPALPGEAARSPHLAAVPQPADATASLAVPTAPEPVLDMLAERAREARRRRIRTSSLWALAGGLGAAGLFAAGYVGAHWFGDEDTRRASGGDDGGARRFLPNAGTPLAAEPFPTDPRDASCYPTAAVDRRVTLYQRPRSKRTLKIPARTEWDSPRVFSVVRRRGDWLAVLAPELRNGEVGWMRSKQAKLDCVRWSLHVDLSRRRLYVRKDGHTMRKMTIAIGSRNHPTPKGRFAVTDKLKVVDKGSPYGCCVLALSGHQTRLPADWPGGDRLAVHATSDLSSIGKPVSLGCMRSQPDQAKWLIKTVPLGAPIFIRT